MSENNEEKRPVRRVIVVEKKKSQDSIETSKEVLEKTLESLQARANVGTLDFDEVKSLCSTVEALLKLSKETRENADTYTKLSDSELLKLAKDAMKVLKDSK